MSFLLFLIPPALSIATLALRRQEWLGCALVVLYVYPQLVLSTTLYPDFALPGTEMPLQVVNAIRLGLHTCVFLASAIWLGVNLKIHKITAHGALAGVSLLVILSMLASCVASGTIASVEGAGRVVVLALYFLNLFVLLHTVNLLTQEDLLTSFGRHLILMALGMGLVTIIATGLYGGYAEWSVRLGRPLNPGVFSAIVFLGFALSLFNQRNALMALAFLALIIASGSRTALLCALFSLWTAASWAGIRVLIVGIGLLLILWILFAGDGALINYVSESGLYGRSDWSAGRLVTWAAALETIRTDWLWGTGGRFQLFSEYLGRDQRIHNGLLEGLASYGVTYAVAAVLFYVYVGWIAFGRRWVGGASTEQECLQAIVLYMVVEFGFGTLYFTNLGDGFSLSALLLLLLTLNKRCQSALGTAGTNAPQSNPPVLHHAH